MISFWIQAKKEEMLLDTQANSKYSSLAMITFCFDELYWMYCWSRNVIGFYYLKMKEEVFNELQILAGWL